MNRNDFHTNYADELAQIGAGASSLDRVVSCPPKVSRVSDPTACADEIASEVRRWYEAHRESWWERRGKHWEYCADNFMLQLVETVQKTVERMNEGS